MRILIFLLKNSGTVKDEHSERCHQDNLAIKKKCQGMWNLSVMADNYWIMTVILLQFTDDKLRSDVWLLHTFTSEEYSPIVFYSINIYIAILLVYCSGSLCRTNRIERFIKANLSFLVSSIITMSVT